MKELNTVLTELGISKVRLAKSLGYRIALGVFIFFLPSLVMLLFKLIGPWGPVEAQTDYNICYSCVVHPWRGCGASQDKQDQYKAMGIEIKLI